jgi:NTE family protein
MSTTTRSDGDPPGLAPAPIEWTRCSLVLGAGGRPGLAYHAGTLLALELHGLAAHDATSITGTSAGSIATAILATGGLVEDLAAYTTGSAPRDEFRDMDDLIQEADGKRPRLDAAALGRLVDVRGGWRAASHLRARRLGAAFVALVPGMFEIRRRFSFLDVRADAVSAMPWRIVAAEQGGGRHVFTAGEAPLSLAVAASCAVPGFFAPVRHGDRRLVDGGCHSMTNADLAADDDSDLVIVIAPTCVQSTDGERPAPAQVILDQEIAMLVAAGKRVLQVRPSPALSRRLGRNPLRMSRCREITAAAFLEASHLLAGLARRAAQPVG